MHTCFGKTQPPEGQAAGGGFATAFAEPFAEAAGGFSGPLLGAAAGGAIAEIFVEATFGAVAIAFPALPCTGTAPGLPFFGSAGFAKPMLTCRCESLSRSPFENKAKNQNID